MPNFTPLEPGDIPYPQYSVTTTEEIAVGVTILKGVIYTKNATGELIVATSDFANGLFQAVATPVVAPALAGDTVQVLGPRTRMMFTTQSAGLVTGDDVIAVLDSTDVVFGVKTSALYLGKIFEIYSVGADGIKKKVTEIGDKIVVETVQA